MNTSPLFLICCVLSTFITTFSKADAFSTEVSSYIFSDSYSNVLPIKQLIKDEWQGKPEADSSHAFTQNELGISAHWKNITFNIAYRADYFVSTNPDTAEAFYLERSNLPLTTKNKYQVALRLHHQQSSGIRLGYQWHFDSVKAGLKLGYWDIKTIRDSYLTGELYGKENNDITGTAELTEFYSEKNFLKRSNNNNWTTDGYGLTVDLFMHWQVNEDLTINLDVKDLYSHFTLKGIGFSQGNVNTEGSYINRLGGQSYLPLYKGVEGSKDYQFELPEHINMMAAYRLNTVNTALSLLTTYKRQGDMNFYYVGAQWQHTQYSQTQLMLDVENTSPKFKYSNQWLTLHLAVDSLSVDKAKQLSIGVSINTIFE